jgi:hypothetical protein
MMIRAVIAVISLGIASICGLGFTQVLGRINEQTNQGKSSSEPARSVGWHVLHTPTRALLRDYHLACPTGTLDRYLYVFYLLGGAALIVFFSDVVSLLSGR